MSGAGAGRSELVLPEALLLAGRANGFSEFLRCHGNIPEREEWQLLWSLSR